MNAAHVSLNWCQNVTASNISTTLMATTLAISPVAISVVIKLVTVSAKMTITNIVTII